MKNIFVLFLLTFSLLTFAQNDDNSALKYQKITQKLCLSKKGYQLVLKEVVNDSRCPEKVTCIWAGEVSIVVSVYMDGKLIEDNTITIPGNNNQNYTTWVSNYLPAAKKNVKNITVFPYPKEGSTINPKDYYLKIGYLK
ncbi:hypothetical protein [Flavobacterium sp. K5-23]|uniref:hypothetical protein n=1 Tax=Flavobacterium sp. K5-23 TaxID=2746225 RepID=UPI00200F8139|nr:hypothetical protein [Flavobacterium sp. K5-23]UQD55661.1 hypothetical protein FLAK523_04325 [Flavobacterium sp. K5-23]